MTHPGSGLNIVSREQWKARQPKEELSVMTEPAAYVFFHHGDSPEAKDLETGCMMARVYQNTHMDDNNWSDIGYSFVVGEDGNVYEGRGWTAVGAHTQGYNAKSIGICVIGNFNERLPDDAALASIRKLIKYGLDQGHISPTFTLKGHRDIKVTDCPGHKLYDLIQSWEHFKPGTETVA